MLCLQTLFFTFLVFGNWKDLLPPSGVGVVASDGGWDSVAWLLLSSAEENGSTVLLAALALLLILLFLQWQWTQMDLKRSYRRNFLFRNPLYYYQTIQQATRIENQSVVYKMIAHI